MTRRRFLQGGAGLVGGMAAFGGMSASARATLATVAPTSSTLSDIEHIVVFMQENRSFDHYYGSLSGVIGFDDPNVLVDPRSGRTVFEQLDPFLLDGAGGYLLPWHLDTSATSAQCLLDVDHLWQTQHLSVAGGANNAWVTSHLPGDSVLGVIGGEPAQLVSGGSRVMGYYTRADLPFHYALADAFTICDRYFCSVMGPTNPNRLYLMTATLDPEGRKGGPDVNNLKSIAGQPPRLSWTTYPELLEAAGVDWFVYSERDDFAENMLDFFVQYADPTSELFRRGRVEIPDGQLVARLRDDVVNGNLPQVSWIVGPSFTTEHPGGGGVVADGAHYTQQILEALTADPAVWAKTLLIITYDENGGFFDHVPPPLAPPGTPGEYLTLEGLANAPEASGIAGPIGLGPRVPTLLVSPFTRGGYVCSDTFDHTSVLRLLENRFGVEIPNITDWRRTTCADLSTAINFAGTPDLTVPDLPDTADLLGAAVDQCASLPFPKLPAEQVMPRQERGTRPRPLAASAVPSAGPIVVTAPPDPALGPVTPSLPATGGTGPAGAAAAALAGALALRTLRSRRSTTPAPSEQS